MNLMNNITIVSEDDAQEYEIDLLSHNTQEDTFNDMNDTNFKDFTIQWSKINIKIRNIRVNP